jgi:hypothetical protein
MQEYMSPGFIGFMYHLNFSYIVLGLVEKISFKSRFKKDFSNLK